MKKLFILLFCMLVAIGCNKDLGDYQTLVDSKYKTEFISTYGAPEVGHTWGFEDVASTRSADPNSNMWIDTPASVTDDEINIVVNHFNNVQNPTSINIEWIDFYVQHVSGAHSNMDWLYCGNEDHIYNFNATKGAIMKMINSSTSNFGYHNSLDSKLHNKYVIQEINGGYYVGFDFEATGQNPNQKEAANGYYNDWIVKISPAYGKIIIAEDLGTNDTDYDFNDVVFGTNNNDVVTLLAAGGTLPLYIDGNEVHSRFGVDVSVMVNTTNFHAYPPVQFKIGHYNNIKDIPIKVDNKGTVFYIQYFRGEPSAKICVDRDFIWSPERVRIDITYPLFKEYVKDQTIKFW